jgi:putative ABC transport system ATP-binding protein
VIGCLDAHIGTYRLDGELVSKLSGDALAAVRNRKIGFVFQQFHLLDRLDALANVELPMIYARRPVAQGKAIAALAVGFASASITADPLRRPAAARRDRARAGNTRRCCWRRADRRARQPPSVELMALFQELNRDGIRW